MSSQLNVGVLSRFDTQEDFHCHVRINKPRSDVLCATVHTHTHKLTHRGTLANYTRS